MRGFLGAVIDDVEQQEDDQQHDRDTMICSVLLRRGAGFRIGRSIRWSCRAGSRRFAVDALLDFLDEAAEVAVLHVGLHVDAQPAVLAGDFVGPDDCVRIVGELAERDVTCPAGVRDRADVAESLDVVALVALEAHLDRKALAALDGGA